jgi:hypothetical protein
MSKRGDIAMTPTAIIAFLTKNKLPIPAELATLCKKPGDDWPKINVKRTTFPPTTPKMNKTEAEFGRILEAMKLRGEILFYCYEGIRLKWGDCMFYKPDFLLTKWDGASQRTVLVEVKGAHIWDRDLVRFRGCRAEWRHVFDFELWQKKGGQWERLL